nr:hypothetical protein [Tanacetum cinerariifolium]
LQLGVESYQKKLNLTKPDTYQTDLRRREAYTAQSNPRGFIYQNKDKKNRLMRIDELHKFSDGTLNDVCNALDDRLKGIRMQYLPSTIWRKGDKDRAAAMIQAIEKMLKTRRIMRNLEMFVGGRLTMDTKIDQQVAMEEALIPHARRLRIGRSNFHLLSDISSKWNTKIQRRAKSNEMYYPRFTKVIIHHFMSKDPSILRRNKVNWHYVRDDHMFTTIKLVSRHQNIQQFGAILPIELTNKDIRKSNTYKEYYVVTIGATPPKPKANVQKTRSSFDTTTPPPTTAAGPRQSTFAKGKQPATTSKAKSLFSLSEVAITEAQQLKLPLREACSKHISLKRVKSTNEEGDNNKGKDGDDDDDEQDDDDARDDDDEEDEGDDEEDDQEEGGDYEQASDEEEFIHPSLSTHTEKETRDEESFDPIPKTRENTDDEGNENDEFLKTIDENMQNIIKEQVKEQIKTSYVVAADLSEMELKKIFIEKVDGNNHLKRRHDDDVDKDEEPSTGSSRGSKRRRERKELESTSAPKEKATRSAGKSTQGSKSRQTLASEYATAEEPKQTTFKMEEPSHLKFETGVDDQPIVESSQHPEWFSQQKKPPTPYLDWNMTFPATHGSIQSWISELINQSDSRSSYNELMDTPVDFSNFLINRLKVNTLTPELLAGPTYELMKGSCKSLLELEYPHNLLKPLPLIPDS